MKKIVKIIVFVLFVFLINITPTLAQNYVCRYKSSDTISESSATGYKNIGCGTFEITIDDKTGEIVADNIKMVDNTDLIPNLIRDNTSWDDFIKGDYNGECPSAYSGVYNHGEDVSYCNIRIRQNDLSYPVGDDVEYTFDYGTRTDEPPEPEENPVEGTDEYVITGVEGRLYRDVASCPTGYKIKKVYVSTIKSYVKGCISSTTKGDYKSTVCEGGINSQYYSAYKYSSVQGQEEYGYHAVVCENVYVTQDNKTQYTCVYNETPCGRIDAARDIQGNISYKSQDGYSIKSNISSSLFTDNLNCPSLYARLESGNTCLLTSANSNGYSTLIKGVLLNDFIKPETPSTPSTGEESETPEVDCKYLLGDPENSQTPAYWFQLILDIMKYIAIIALLGLSTMDFFKAIVADDKDALKKALVKTIKRFIYCILLFFLPILVNILMKLLGAYGTCNLG